MGYKDSEKQKEYNKTYHTANKDKIKEKIVKLECCEYCGRSVQHWWMTKHQESKLCEKVRKIKQKVESEKQSNNI